MNSKYSHFHRVRAWLVLASFLGGFSGTAAVVTDCSEAGLRAAMSNGGVVTFACNGIIQVTNTLIVSGNVILDAAGFEVTISGGDTVRVFDVGTNASLTLNRLTVIRGRAIGAAGVIGQASTPGQGGAVRVEGGRLTAIGCTFDVNFAAGGKGISALSALTVPGQGGTGEGGAIFAVSAELNFTNCTFIRNTVIGGSGGDAASGALQAMGGLGGASRGGSICAISSRVHLEGGSVAGNRADIGSPGAGLWSGDSPDTTGGGVYALDCTLSSSGVTWRGNIARVAGGACAFQGGAAQLATSVFTENSVGQSRQALGGAVWTRSNQLSLTDCTIRDNYALGAASFLIRSSGRAGGKAEGAGVYSEGGELRIVNSTFARNTAHGGDGMIVGPPLGALSAGRAQGGGLLHSGTGLIVNSTFTGNAARSGRAVFPDGSASLGGGLVNLGGRLDIQFTTLASNAVSDAQTIASVASSGAGCAVTDGVLTLANSLLAGNLATSGASGETPANASGTVTDGGNNLSSDGTPAFVAAGSVNHSDPRLGPLADNGGITPTMALLPGSPAIDAADSADCPATDQRGVSRPSQNGCDIGSFEFISRFVILTIEKTGSQTYRLSGTGVPGQAFRVETSERFDDWTNTAKGAVDDQGSFAVEVNADLAQQRFYRIAAP